MKIMKNIGSAVIVIALLVGWRFYNKASDSDDIKAALLEVCESENACLIAVDTYFEPCFDQSYDMGGRREAASLDASELTACINQQAGIEYFAYAE